MYAEVHVQFMSASCALSSFALVFFSIPCSLALAPLRSTLAPLRSAPAPSCSPLILLFYFFFCCSTAWKGTPPHIGTCSCSSQRVCTCCVSFRPRVSAYSVEQAGMQCRSLFFFVVVLFCMGSLLCLCFWVAVSDASGGEGVLCDCGFHCFCLLVYFFAFYVTAPQTWPNSNPSTPPTCACTHARTHARTHTKVPKENHEHPPLAPSTTSI